jgi:hypothetical protein
MWLVLCRDPRHEAFQICGRDGVYIGIVDEGGEELEVDPYMSSVLDE